MESTASTIQIHVSGRPFTRDCRPRWLLEELGVAYTPVPVGIFSGDARKPAYLATNPTGKVPFLVDGEVAIFESGAILIYLADKYGAGEVAPAQDDPARGEYLQWLFFAQTTIEGPATRLFANRTFLRERPSAGERAAEAEAELIAKAPIVAPVLESRTYLLGDRFTAADVMLGSALYWVAGGGALDKLPTLAAYYGRLAARPAFQRIFGEPPSPA
ncbi:MAG: glutathione S-transferase family protein [Myxococcales bacterium]|nr:glutathione S-transferase family protein [Myxococcales bacterium]